MYKDIDMELKNKIEFNEYLKFVSNNKIHKKHINSELLFHINYENLKKFRE